MAERGKQGEYTAEVSIKASYPGQLMRILRRVAGLTLKDLEPIMGSESAASRMESGQRKFPKEKLPDFVNLVGPHFPDPDAIRQILEDSFEREDVLEGLPGDIIDVLRADFSLEQLSALRGKLALPENRERLADFLGNL